MRPPLRVGTVYDFRNTPESGMDMPSLYAAIMDQVVMLDGVGIDLVWFTECEKELTSFVREYGITDLVTWGVPPGMRPEQMNGSLERFVRDVAPRVKAAAAAP
jgi:hypothetical protein